MGIDSVGSCIKMSSDLAASFPKANWSASKVTLVVLSVLTLGLAGVLYLVYQALYSADTDETLKKQNPVQEQKQFDCIGQSYLDFNGDFLNAFKSIHGLNTREFIRSFKSFKNILDHLVKNYYPELEGLSISNPQMQEFLRKAESLRSYFPVNSAVRALAHCGFDREEIASLNLSDKDKRFLLNHSHL